MADDDSDGTNVESDGLEDALVLWRMCGVMMGREECDVELVAG